MKLNNIKIVKPKGFFIDEEKISTRDRTASGRSVEDVVAIKKMFTLNYVGIYRKDLQTFIDVYRNFVPVIFNYIDNGIEETAFVRINSMPRGIYTEMDNVSYDINIELEEV